MTTNYKQEAVQTQETYKSEDLKKTLLDLASLNNHKNSKVALSARQVKGNYSDVIMM